MVKSWRMKLVAVWHEMTQSLKVRLGRHGHICDYDMKWILRTSFWNISTEFLWLKMEFRSGIAWRQWRWIFVLHKRLGSSWLSDSFSRTSLDVDTWYELISSVCTIMYLYFLNYRTDCIEYTTFWWLRIRCSYYNLKVGCLHPVACTRSGFGVSV
jgi:hypothetical protein